jgi:hypothetical protein
MRAWVLLLIFLVGCATGLRRDAHCLAGLTPDFLDAHEEVSDLDRSWRASLCNYSVQVSSPLTVYTGSSDSRHESWPAVTGPALHSLDTSGANAEQAEEAYRKWVEAKRRHHLSLNGMARSMNAW